MDKEESRHIIERVSLTIFIFAFMGGMYIVVNSWVHPATLPTQLTHLTPWIREDTFGILCWVISFFSFLTWNLVRK